MLWLRSGTFEKKGRKYPIKKDAVGQSARKRAFQRFNEGLMPAQVCKDLDITVQTARRYYADWKKLPPGFANWYFTQKQLKKERHELYRQLVQLLADTLDIPFDDAERLTQTPWALHQMMRGKYKKQIEAKLFERNVKRAKVAFDLLEAYEMCGVSLDDIFDALDRLKRKAQPVVDTMHQASNTKRDWPFSIQSMIYPGRRFPRKHV